MSDEQLTLEERACNYETMKHIQTVQRILHGFAKDLIDRGELHDQSKLAPPEVAMFTEYTNKLADCTYGSPEYEEFRRKMGPALVHHYAKNRHHPEFYKNGIEDMTLTDLVEMLSDWKAATLRHHDGNIRKSLESNTGRFKIERQLYKILENTINQMD